MIERKILNNMFVKNLNDEQIKEVLSIDNKYFSKPMQEIIEKCRAKYASNFSIDIDLLEGCDVNFLNGMYDVEDSIPGDNSKYLNELKNNYCIRELKNIGENSTKNEIIKKVEKVRDELLEQNQNIDMVSLKDVMTKYYTNLESQAGMKPLKTGWSAFDNIIQCMPGDLVIICARPGAGKTAFSMNLALNMAKQGKRGLFFSLEMSESSMINRLMAITSGVELNKLKDLEKYKKLTKEELHMMTEGSEILARIDERLKISSGTITLDKIKTLAKATKGKFDYLVIDYLQLIRAEGKDRFTQVTEISLALKEIAMECKIPVIALSQLSREVDKRADKTPMLSDLRESGQLEQDASIVLGLLRPVYYDPEYEDKTLLECHILKNRDGESGNYLRFDFLGATQRVNAK